MMKQQPPHKSLTLRIPRTAHRRIEEYWTALDLCSKAIDFVHDHTQNIVIGLEPCIFFILLAYLYLHCPSLLPGSWTLLIFKLGASSFILSVGMIQAESRLPSSWNVKERFSILICTNFLVSYILAWMLLYILLVEETWPGKYVLLLAYFPAFLTWNVAQIFTIFTFSQMMYVPEFFVRWISGTLDSFPSYNDYSRDMRYSFHTVNAFLCVQGGWCLECMCELEDGEWLTQVCDMPTHVMHLSCAARLMARERPCPVCGQKVSAA
ncbi:MAG: hypothetical protein P4L50_30410 [Anaerolineaceae bacterium]|nr:hypothetical protein [Anaerolineaceae bacterium]